MPPKRKRILRSESANGSGAEDLGTISLSDGQSEDDEDKSTGVAESDAEEGQQSLFALDFALHDHSRAIVKLIHEPLGDGPPFCHLRDIPDDVIWSQSNTLSTPGAKPRAVVIVAFGSLAGFQLVLKRYKSTTLSVLVELFSAADADRLRRINDMVNPGGVTSYGITARRESAGPRSRLLNVYDRSGGEQVRHKVAALSVNELVGGDVVRMEMRCVRVKVGEGYWVEFKLKTLSMYMATPRGVDIMQ